MHPLNHCRLWNSLTLLLTLAMLGCQRGGDTDKDDSTVVLFAAASTKDALGELVGSFYMETKIKAIMNADDSAKLATQIAEGAPAHVFLSANERWADFVKEKDLAQESIHLLGNKLVVVVPRGNPADISRPEDLGRSGVHRLAVAGPTVPAGIYARQALEKLRLWDELQRAKKIVSGENVRGTLAFVERGEAEAGIVYATDAEVSDRVQKVCAFPEYTHEPIRYSLVLLKAGSESAAARSLFEFLQSPRAKGVFHHYGFTILDKK